MSLTGLGVPMLQGIIDKILRVDSRWVLNAEGRSEDVDGDIATAMRTIVDQIKMEAFDNDEGIVDYRTLKDSSVYQQYKQISARLQDFDPSSLQSRAEKLAFWINIYNSLIIDAVIAFGVKNSVWDAGKGFFRKAAYNIGGLRYSADDIEHGILRGNRRHTVIPLPQFGPGDLRLGDTVIPMEPRIHFTLVCASSSCPIITVYHASDIEEELEIATDTFINGGGIIIKPDQRKVSLSRIFKWYQGDFGKRSDVMSFILLYLRNGEEKEFLRNNHHRVNIEYQKYDWSLNEL